MTSHLPSRTRSSSLLVFFLFLSTHCFFSSLSLIQPCEAIARTSNSNHRVDTPSPDEFPLLTGPDFEYTNRTPLGGLSNPREYANGALATQKLVAAPIIPIDRQMWVGIDTRTAYFGNNFGKDKIQNVPKLLQAGIRRLVIDLWWDEGGLGWQLCPRLKRDGTQLATVMAALDQELKDLGEAEWQIREMHKNQSAAQDAQPSSSSSSSSSSPEADDASSPTTTLHSARTSPMHRRHSRYTEHHEGLERRAEGRNQHEGSSARDKHSSSSSSLPDRRRQQQRGRPTGHEWYRRKKLPQRPPIKAQGKDSSKNDSSTSAARGTGAGAEASSSQESREKLHRLGVNKGVVASYDKSTAVDTTVDGITCSSGEDLFILLQSLADWIDDSSQTELEDVMLLVLNLNELGNQSLGSRPPPRQPTTPLPTPTPTPPINGTGTGNGNGTTVPTWTLVSPNTNKTVKAQLPNLISLRELFMDAFPTSIYTPTQLQSDRSDLGASWWKSGPVGLDYYNVSTNPTTGKLQTPSGWPTTFYLTETVMRYVVVSIGANRLSANTTYNITDDFTTLYAPGMLGPSMTNSSLIQVTAALNQSRCNFPVSGVMMMPTGSEGNTTLDELPGEPGTSVQEVTWSFASMSDGDLLPWSYTSGQLAATCGFSTLLEGRAPALTFSEHTATTIWSWDLDQPVLNQTRSRDRRCGAMQSNGRWAVQDCNTKLPVACRKINTSGQWLIYDKGAANYRDVTCPDGYQFDVPRTAQENKVLHKTLLEYWNETSPSFYTSILDRQREEQQARELDRIRDEPFLELLSKGTLGAPHKRYDPVAAEEDEDQADNNNNTETEINDPDHEGSDEQDGEGRSPASSSPPLSGGHNGRLASGETDEVPMKVKEPVRQAPPRKAIAGAPNEGMIWIDISSWQTAGCWIPGGIHGICPYQEPDNTVALQEIIKVSTIGGVIILVLACMFLYLKCRRNVRHRKDNKRRAMVREKIMQTEVETVPA